MSASQNNLSLVVNQQDSAGVNILNRTMGAFAYSGVVGQFIDGLLTTTGSTSITLPKTTILQVMVRNTHATANITVNWTPESATGSIIAGKVGPSGVLGFWQTSTGQSGAITALALTADTANTTYELYLGG